MTYKGKQMVLNLEKWVEISKPRRGELRKPIVVSLFVGAGGLDLGLVQAGLDVGWGIDNDPDAIATYKENIGSNVVCGDIRKIESEKIPDCDVVVGGFPCQGFSVANKFRTVHDERNVLYREMLRVIHDKKPMWFVAENVVGIISLANGIIFKKILGDFAKEGYRVKHQIVNMADYGVPQTRRRVFILGTRRDLPAKFTLTHPVATHSKNGIDGRLPWKTIGEALRELAKYGTDLPNSVGSQYKVKYRNFTGHRKTEGNKPSPTILARGNGKGGVCAVPHPEEPRRLTVRESAYIQTFPPKFQFHGRVGSMYRQVGNAVPALYAYRLGLNIIDVFNRWVEDNAERK